MPVIRTTIRVTTWVIALLTIQAGTSSMADDRMQQYSDIIIEHSQFPRHHGKIEKPTHEAQGENPFCGDRIRLQFAVNEHGLIEQAAVECTGCAISTASASLLATHLHGLNLQQAQQLFWPASRNVHRATHNFDTRMTSPSPSSSPSIVATLSFTSISSNNNHQQRTATSHQPTTNSDQHTSNSH